MNYPPAVVIPSDRPASLGIARSLGKRGIPVFGVDPDPRAIGMVSRYLRPCPIPGGHSEQSRLQFLLDLGETLGQKAVLYPLSDDYVVFCSKYRAELKKYFSYRMPDHETIANLVSKKGLHQIAQQLEIPAPRMFMASNQDDVDHFSNAISYPVILKPIFSPSWLRPEINTLLRENAFSGAPKVAFCRNAQELADLYRQIAKYDEHMIIEEVVPGEDDRLAYVCFYCDGQSQTLAVFAGQKLRVLPVNFGSATFVRSFRDPELENISMQLLNGCRYQGPGGVEFKKDPRDGKYKLIEFNARFGMWDTLSIRCGIDIPYIAYCDALGRPAEAKRTYREGVLWVDLQRDIRAFLMYHRRGQLRFGKWLNSLRGEKDWAIFAWGDIKPAIAATIKLFIHSGNDTKNGTSPDQFGLGIHS